MKMIRLDKKKLKNKIYRHKYYRKNHMFKLSDKSLTKLDLKDNDTKTLDSCSNILKELLKYQNNKKMKWSRDIIHFSTTIRYNGGKKAYEFIKGIGKNYNIKLPSISTLKNKMGPIICYPDIDKRKIQSIVDSMKEKNIPLEGGIVFDEMDIRPGIVYRVDEGLIGRISNLPDNSAFEFLLHKQNNGKRFS